ncbi:MAG: hypothetical protein Q4C15_12345 [Eubacteriales bacterium]|nr:hypothetical protein [Eubacteriales bacterium]
MSVEYGLLTGDLEEKKILKVLNDKLQRFFVEMTSEQYNLYKSYKFSKMKKRNGKSYNPKRIPWDYEYDYVFFHKQYGVYLELYPNINETGEQKFKKQDVKWVLYLNECGFYLNNWGIKINNNNPDIRRFIDFFLKDLPFDVVLLYEYEKGEDRI